MNKQTKQNLTLVGSAGLGAGLGAGLMYLLDPQGGRGRRAAAKTTATSALTKGGDAVKAVKKTSKHLGNRTKGLVAGAGARLRGGELTDALVSDRVRSKLGHVLSHPKALEVAVLEGRVTLTGPVLALEADRLLDAVRSVKGVKDVECRFDLHEGEHPALEGDGEAASNGSSRSWKKKGALGVALGTLAVGLLAGGVSRRGGKLEAGT